jgi:hypothetical protein
MTIPQAVQKGLRYRAQWRDRKWRRPPEFRFGPPTGAPSIYYLAPDENTPSGGVRVIYRHVDQLQALGFRAAVVHTRPNFRCTWFENSTTVVAASEVSLSPQDLLVVPEYTAPVFDGLPKGIRVVVFNQGPHHTFDGVEPGRRPYHEVPGLEAILTISEDGARLLSFAFPTVPVRQVRNVIDPAVFHPGEAGRPRVVSFVPSRRPDELAQLLHVLSLREEFAHGGWVLQPLSGLSESEMAGALRRTAIFISLSHRDGFGLPPAEAMACGAYVVGHDGGGGREFFDPAYSTSAHDNTEIMEGLLQAMRCGPERLRSLGLLASSRILGHYTEDGMRSDLKAFYEGLI